MVEEPASPYWPVRRRPAHHGRVLEVLHVLSLFAWIPLALLAHVQRDQRKAARVLWGLCAAAGLLCAYALFMHFVWSRTVVAPIRADLLLVIPLMTLTSLGVGLWGVRKPGAPAKVASALLLALSLPTLVVFGKQMLDVRADLAQLDSRPALIFEAQFRNPVTFRNSRRG
jgi:xanthine/uracil permease